MFVPYSSDFRSFMDCFYGAFVNGDASILKFLPVPMIVFML